MPDSKLPSEIALVVEQVVRSSRGAERANGRRRGRREREGKCILGSDGIVGCG